MLKFLCIPALGLLLAFTLSPAAADVAADPGEDYVAGQRYYSGDGVPQSYLQAAAYFRRAADAGQPYAQYSLALMYEHGYGLPKDLGEARRWYQTAQQQGHLGAAARLSMLDEGAQPKTPSGPQTPMPAEIRLFGVAPAPAPAPKPVPVASPVPADPEIAAFNAAPVAPAPAPVAAPKSRPPLSLLGVETVRRADLPKPAALRPKAPKPAPVPAPVVAKPAPVEPAPAPASVEEPVFLDPPPKASVASPAPAPTPALVAKPAPVEPAPAPAPTPAPKPAPAPVVAAKPATTAPTPKPAPKPSKPAPVAVATAAPLPEPPLPIPSAALAPEVTAPGELRLPKGLDPAIVQAIHRYRAALKVNDYEQALRSLTDARVAGEITALGLNETQSAEALARLSILAGDERLSLNYLRQASALGSESAQVALDQLAGGADLKTLAASYAMPLAQ